jgi:phosphoglycolate phosphatase
VLEELGLARHFQVIIGGDSMSVRKPDPGHLHTVIERLGGAPSRAVMIGDSEYDLLAARAAGLPCLLVSFGYTPVPAAELVADRVIDHMRELPGALAGLARPLTRG